MPNARVGAMPQPSMRQGQRDQREQLSSKDRCKQSKGITMEDLKYQTAMRLAQEQSRRTTTVSSNKKPSANFLLLQSTSSHCRKKTENKLRSIGSKKLNISSIEDREKPQHHTTSSYNSEFSQQSNVVDNSKYLVRQSQNSKFSQQSNVVDNSKYLLGQSQHLIGVHKYGRNDYDERRETGPSEQFQQQVSHHYHPPTRSRAMCHSYEMKPQQFAVPSLNHKKQVPSKTYRHGLTVLELKEMTRSRLAAEAHKGQVINEGSKKTFVEGPVIPIARNTQNCRGSLLQNIKERLHLDVFNKQKQNSKESISSGPSVGFGQNNSLSCKRTANDRDDNLNRFGNVYTRQVAQNHSSLNHPSNLSVPDPAAVTRRYHDNLLPLQSPCSNDTFDNSSIHSFNSGIQSDYHGSTNSYLPSSQSDDQSSYLSRRSAFNPIALDFDAVDNSNSTRNGNVFGGSFLPSSSGSSTQSASEFRNLYSPYTKDDSSAYSSTRGQHINDSFPSSSASHVTSLSTSIDDIYCGIIGQGSSDTLPTINLSTDSYCDSEESNVTAMKFGSPIMNLSTDSFCESEDDFNFVPLNFGPHDQHVSDRAVSRNGDLPNSVAESVFTPHSFPTEIKQSLSEVFRNSHMGTRDSHDNRYEQNPVSASSCIGQDAYGRKSWDEPDDVSIAQFLGDFDSRLSFNSSPEITTSSLFLSKIDPEVTKR